MRWITREDIKIDRVACPWLIKRFVDPAAEYYEDYYAVFFLDPDGIKLEGMKYGELTAKKKRAKAARKKSK